MKVVYKYELLHVGEQTIAMPREAEILCVQVQHGRPCIWALVDPGSISGYLNVTIVGTGHNVYHDIGKYLGTFQIDSGNLIFHVFYRWQ